MASNFPKPPVLLGVPDEPVASPQDSNYTTTKYGGACDPIPPLTRRDFRRSCRICGRSSQLISQIYCPWSESPFHRTIYLLACTHRDCWNKEEGWVALRGQAISVDVESRVTTEKKADIFELDDEWGDEEDDADDIDFPLRNLSSTRVTLQDSAVDESEDVGNRRQDNSESAKICQDVIEEGNVTEEHFQPFYMACVEDEGSHEVTDGHVQQLLMNYNRSEGVAEDIASMLEDKCQIDGFGIEKYEKEVARHGDAAFQRFVDTIARNPSQILRYSLGGDPLLMEPMSQAVAPCQSCGSKRIFELQLLPTMVNFLRADSELSIDFGTALVFSCEKSCWNVDELRLVEERVVLQSEPGREFVMGN